MERHKVKINSIDIPVMVSRYHGFSLFICAGSNKNDYFRTIFNAKEHIDALLESTKGLLYYSMVQGFQTRLW